MGRRPGFVLVLLAAFAAAGCGTVGRTEAGDATNGKELFQERCAGCHTLSDAGTRSQIGPDLDAAFRRARKDGMGESTVRDVVRGQIEYPVQNPPTGARGMPGPEETLKGIQDRDEAADDIAVYVAMVAGTRPEGAQVAAGRGGGQADGKSIFASAGCGGCHILADAGTNGTIGPNLDEAKPSVQLAVQRVTNGKGAMPSFADQLSSAQIQAVARYVAQAAGK